MEPRCNLECKYLTSDDYKDLLWTTLAEFPGKVPPPPPFVGVELLVILWLPLRKGFGLKQGCQERYGGS